MKYDSLKNLSRFTILAAAIAAVVVSQRAQAGALFPSATISIFENSSTSLTVIYNGMDITATGVMNTSLDHWTVTLPDQLAWQSFMQPPGIQWKEPEFAFPSSPFVNFVFITDPDGITNQFFVASDQPALALITGFQNNGSTLDVGADGQFQGGSPIMMTFTDNGDPVPAVPETGSSLGLLASSLIAFGGASRIRYLRRV